MSFATDDPKVAGREKRPFNCDLNGKTALVTGASSGIGEHLARTLADAGARVALCARRTGRLANIVREISAAGLTVAAFAMDVRDPQSIDDAFSAAQTTFGPIDVIINNAGTNVAKPALEVTPDEWDQILDTNLRGAFLVACAGARRLIECGRGGSIVNVASITAFRTAGRLAPYAASKAGLVQLTKSLAVEWARHGIRVNAIAPGYLSTEINQEFWSTPAGEAMIKRIPQRRLAELEDLEGPVLLLASDASAHITGASFTIDGGHTASNL